MLARGKITEEVTEVKKITLYIGLNDKDSKIQEVGTIDAYKMVSNVIEVDSTITEGRGIYKHEDGTVVSEVSLIVELLDFDNILSKGWVKNKINQIKTLLNQESVAVQYQEVDSELI